MGGGQLARTSGNQSFDAGFQREIALLNGAMGVYPSFFMLNDSGAPNAYANPQAMDPRFPDGTVAFGYTLMLSEWRAASAGGTNFSIPTIMAHEFGHIAQFKAGFKLPTKLMELQADYIAGWYIGNRNGSDGWTSRALMDSLQSLFNKGDYNFNNPTHHGTPQERTSSFLTGFQNAHSSLGSALRDSLQYVQGQGRPLGAPGSRSKEGSSMSSGDPRPVPNTPAVRPAATPEPVKLQKQVSLLALTLRAAMATVKSGFSSAPGNDFTSVDGEWSCGVSRNGWYVCRLSTEIRDDYKAAANRFSKEVDSAAEEHLEWETRSVTRSTRLIAQTNTFRVWVRTTQMRDGTTAIEISIIPAE